MTKGPPRHKGTWWWKGWLPNERYVTKPGENLNRLKIKNFFRCGQEVYAAVLAVPSYKNSMLIFRVNLAGITASGLLERGDVIIVCCMKMMLGLMLMIWRNF